MRSKRISRLLLALLPPFLLAVAPAAQSENGYAERAGSAAGVYQDNSLNFALDLAETPYIIVDFSEQMPDAAFAAMRFDPLVFAMTVVEDVGFDMTTEQYAEIVKTATLAKLHKTGGAADATVDEIGGTSIDGIEAIQLAYSGDINGVPTNYVITAFVNGRLAYQLTTFAARAAEGVVKTEADSIAQAFSFPGDGPVSVVAAKRVDTYSSKAFGYAVLADAGVWFPWANLEDDYVFADMGALSGKSYGAVVMPFCWQGKAPTRLALLDVFLEQFGEKYPAPFITREEDIARGDVQGVYLSGEDTVDGEEFTYDFWIVANEHCAYTVAAWGPASGRDTKQELEDFWNSVAFKTAATIFGGEGITEKERRINAFFLNQTGMHYYQARSYREAFRFLSQATDLDSSDSTYLINALRVLSELDSYKEAYEWLQPRRSMYPDDQEVRSWDAWLAYQVDESDKAVAIYAELFADGYREDDEFGVYLEMLADRGQWDELDAAFAAYVGEDLTDKMRRLKATLLSRRGRFEEAIAILDAMSEGRPFNADLVYAKIDVYDAMQSPAEILSLAELLIANNYESLESWFYKGYAEYSLKSYVESRTSFEKALRFSPTSSFVQEYIDAINGILGEGDNAIISDPVAAVELPRELQAKIGASSFGDTRDGYGAFFLNQIVGYDFDGTDYVTKTQYLQVKVQDAKGIEQFSTLEFDFDPAYEQLYVNSIVVRDASGDVLAEANRDAFYVTNTVDGYEASTEKTAHLPVPSLKPGVVIDVIVSKRVGVETGTMPLDIHYLSRSRPVEYSALYVTGDPSKFSFDSFGVGAPKRSADSTIWEIVDPVIYRWEPLTPYYDRILPWVTVGTTSPSWSTAGSDYFAKIADKLDTGRVADTARRLVEGVNDDIRKVEIISRYVQKELHYEAIEFGRRAYIPKTARETLRDRYGDCKDHAVLLYTMLNSVDILAELALVNINQQVSSSLPNVDQFDHMIVAVPHGENHLFIDTTDKDLKLGTLPPRHMAGNKALLIGEKSTLVDIPEFQHGDSALHVERAIESADNREIRILEVGTFTGYQAAELRGQLRDIESSEMLATMQRWVADRYSDAVVDEAYVDNLLEADSELIVELQYRLPLDDGDSFKLPGFLEAEYLEVGRLADRRFVFEKPAPFDVSAVTTVQKTGTAKLAVVSSKPEADESRFGHWQHNVDRRDDSWIFQLNYTGRGSEYGADEYDEYAAFHRRLIGSIEQPVVIQ